MLSLYHLCQMIFTQMYLDCYFNESMQKKKYEIKCLHAKYKNKLMVRYQCNEVECSAQDSTNHRFICKILNDLYSTT